MIERIVLPDLGTSKAAAVTRSDLAKLHLKWKHTPTQANRMLAIVSSLYGFAARRGLVPEGRNPARGIEKYPEQRRERPSYTLAHATRRGGLNHHPCEAGAS